jgi:hypothetical protein
VVDVSVSVDEATAVLPYCEIARGGFSAANRALMSWPVTRGDGRTEVDWNRRWCEGEGADQGREAARGRR